MRALCALYACLEHIKLIISVAKKRHTYARKPQIKRNFMRAYGTKAYLDKSFWTFLDPPKNGDSRAQNGDFVRGVLSKRPITGRISKRGFENGDLAASIRRALTNVKIPLASK